MKRVLDDVTPHGKAFQTGGAEHEKASDQAIACVQIEGRQRMEVSEKKIVIGGMVSTAVQSGKMQTLIRLVK